ncbi:MAG: hypothetical protein AB7G28_05540 [Pirellulales bacterium]
MATAQEVFSQEVSTLPPSEQLRLAKLILEGLMESSSAALDFRDHWSEEDVRDLAAFSLEYTDRVSGEE